ncbi:hypothetical protein PR003_g16046 [Phytophthora rubi]|uniref:Uncharacterized protein n=1 Tax=Phytophthora rubi TaxID=129364 RepID=A0A6A4EP97_9STRA|nr:hypothetical protein PR003_g16046 [Phytophthora rubi]
MATAEPAPPYDDGSSTESEYYFDPAEEAEELAAYAWEHALDAPAPPNQPQVAKLNENIAIKEEFSDYRSVSDGSEDIALPQGSEWSHGAAGAAVCDDAVERALAMASRFEREMRNAQREEALTADTLNGNDHEHEQDEEPPGEIKQKDKTVMRSLSSGYSGEVKVKAKMKSKIVSLKSVKTPTPPASATNSVVVGLRRPPTKVVGAPSELERGLSVARSQWRAADSQKASPMNSKTVQAKSEEVKVASGKRGEQVKSPSMSMGIKELEKNTSKKPSTFRHIFDEFERKVHKLKLREADLNEKQAAQTRNRRDSRNFGNRRRGIAVEKAQLEAQDLERFEKLYESMTVSKGELATYQTRREFAYRVVCYKRKQAALQEQTGGQTPEETAMHWRRMDEEREQLVRENSELFHNVMIGQHELGRTYEMRGKRSGPRKAEKRSRSSDGHDGQPFLKRIARGLNAAHRQLDVSSNSRVVAGASLRHRSEDKPLPPRSSNTPWFLKG